MNFSRRQALLTTLFGSGYVGLRAVATGLPVAFLLNPRKALADMTCEAGVPAPTSAQYVIFSTSGAGDPINANCPGSYSGSYNKNIQGIVHAGAAGFSDATAPTVTVGGQQYKAAAPWGSLLADTSVASRTVFFHMATDVLIHPDEPEVLALNGAAGNEMLPSLIAKATQPILGTIQTQPVSVGAATPSEALSFDGAPLPIIPPAALQDTLLNPTVGKNGMQVPSPLSNLQGIRDQTMNRIYGIYKNVATPQQQQYLDQLITSQQQVRKLNQCLLGQLASLPNDPVAAQVVAAITLIQLNVSPVIAIHIPFGGDNHGDPNLATEVAQTITGVGATAADGGADGSPTTGIAFLLSMLRSTGLQDQVSFMNLNVFGRTLGGAGNGRGHNSNHHVSVCIGKPFKGGVIGGVQAAGSDFGAQPIDTSTGTVASSDTIYAFAMTMLQAAGAPSSVVQSVQSTTGQVVTAALA
jgi:hypothetical protein